MKFAILVEIDVKDTSKWVSPEDGISYGYVPNRKLAVEYVKEAVETWGGQRHPDDPFFPTNIKVVVR